MASRTTVIDSGGVARQVRRMAVVDSGGTTRIVSRMFVVDAGGVSRLVYGGLALANKTISSLGFGFFPAQSTYTLGSDGVASFTRSPSPAPVNGVYPGEWSVGGSVPGIGAGFECRATLIGGDPLTAGDALGVWLNLGTARFWERGAVPLGLFTSTLNVEIGLAGQNTALVSATIVLEAEREP